MKTYTIADIRELGPCYDPVTGLDEYGDVKHPGGFLSEDWTGTAVDVLRVQNCPLEDRLWVVSQWIDDRTLRLFAVWCARQALKLVDNPDPRSLAACDVAERYANGEATQAELTAARDAAWDAARDAAWDAAWAAAWATARDAARDAAWDAAWDAARDAAWAAARDAARAAARAAQIEHLIKMLEVEDVTA